jgi:hypothetical protein
MDTGRHYNPEGTKRLNCGRGNVDLGPRCRVAFARNVLLNSIADIPNLAGNGTSAFFSAGRSRKHPHSQADTDTRRECQDITQGMVLSLKLSSDLIDVFLDTFSHGFCSTIRLFQKIQTRLEKRF